MTLMRPLWLVTAGCLMAVFTVSAEEMMAGDYHGYYNETRWGDKVFHIGPYVITGNLSHTAGPMSKRLAFDVSK